uniref:Uncharacterized protein n=1 Tax=Chenopodium quinoa TaxID=63459 RepID=A0A803LS46_CHEQI
MAAAKKSDTEEDDIKPHIRASSIPRPRAVISSPDNDQILGSKYQKRSQSRQLEGKCTRMSHTSALKNYNLPQRRQTGGKCTQTSTTSTLKTHNQAQNRQSDGRYGVISTTSTLKAHNLAQTKQSEGKCTQMSTRSKKPLNRGEYKEMTTISDMKAEEGSAIQVRVPVANITKAKPCFMIT